MKQKPKRKPKKKGDDRSTHERMQHFLDSYRTHGNLVRAAREAQVSAKIHYVWLRKNAGYREAFEQVKLEAAGILESEAIRRASEGWLEPIHYQGKQCGTVRRYSDGLMQFLLRGMLPEKYGAQRTEVSGPQGGPIQTTVKVVFVKPGDTDNGQHSQLP